MVRTHRIGWQWLAGVGITGAVAASWVAGADFPAAVQTPGLVPERIVLGLEEDPAHGQAVAWRTRRPVEHPVAQIAPCSASPEFAANARTVAATSQQLDAGSTGLVHHHTVSFTGLEPDRSYCYRVGDGTTWSEWSSLRTAAQGTTPFRFIYLGDAQDSVKSHWSRAVRAAYAAAPDARFILMAGDLVRKGYNDDLWGEWCYALGFIPSMLPILAAPGNHDLHRPPTEARDNAVWSVQPTWRVHLSMPANGPANAPDWAEAVWFVDYQGVRLVGLDANLYSEEDFSPEKKRLLYEAQPRWLDALLTDNPNRWTIVVQHEPIYPVVKDRDFAELRGVLRPIFDRHRVDLVLSAHEHCYARSHKLAGDRVVGPSEPGTVYVVSVSGPKLRQPGPRFADLMAVERGDAQMYQVISVSPDRLRLEAYTVDGELADAFDLTKDPRGRSTYSHRAPHQPVPSPTHTPQPAR